MDAYLASKDLKSSKNFYLNVNFEILNGCKFSCRGCYVEKNAQEPITHEQSKNLTHLLDSFTNSLYDPFIAFINPTDFLVADNFMSTFSQPQVIETLNKFKRLSLQTTYLDVRKAVEIATLLNTHYSKMELEINIVVDPAKIMDETYLRTIEINKKTFLALLEFEDVRTFGIMNVYDYSQTKIADLLRDYNFMHNRVAHLFETTIDYNFSIGRSKDISNEEFVALTNRIKDLFDTSLVSKEKAEYLRFSFGKLTDSLVERQYNYRNGKLYYSPLMYERFVSFREEFQVPMKDFTANEIENFEMMTQLQQYGYAPENEECEECPFLASCIDRGILFMMKSFGTKECLVAKEALKSVNSMSSEMGY